MKREFLRATPNVYVKWSIYVKVVIGQQYLVNVGQEHTMTELSNMQYFSAGK